MANRHPGWAMQTGVARRHPGWAMQTGGGPGARGPVRGRQVGQAPWATAHDRVKTQMTCEKWKTTPQQRLLSIVALLTIILISGCTNEQFREFTQSGRPRASDGVIDLRDTDLSDGVPLDGEWEFYWNQRLSRAEITEPGIRPSHTVRVPGPWHSSVVDDHTPHAMPDIRPINRDVTRTGFATYRLRVQIDNHEELGAVHLRLSNIATSYRIIVDGTVVAIAGQTGESPGTVLPRWTTQVASFVPTGEEFDLIVQVFNFHYARSGIIHSLELADSNIYSRPIRRQRYRDWFLFGALVSIGALHLVLYFLHRDSRSVLSFSIFTASVAMRILTTGEPPVLSAQSVLQWELVMKLEYLTLFSAVPAFGLYVSKLFQKEFSARLQRWLIIIMTVPVVFTLVTPARIFGLITTPYSILVIALMVYVIRVAVRAIRSGRRGGNIFMLGFLVLIPFVMNDILHYQGLLRTGYQFGVGAVVFVGFQAVLLALRNADAYRRIERLLREREALQELTNIDSLTEVSNRRHFDEVYMREFQRARREGDPLSLIMIDIDGFKPFNDYYGHPAGDQVLRQVAAEIRSRARRASDLVARYGGEEFCIVLPSTDEHAAVRLSEQIRTAIEQLQLEHTGASADNAGSSASAPSSSAPSSSDPRSSAPSSSDPRSSAPRSSAPRITASFGVAGIVPHRASSPDALLHLADSRLYRAKESGRNRVVPDPSDIP